MKLERLLQTNALFDFYGGMLTTNQQKIVESYIKFNASLAEIAEQNGTTRQAVSDVLRRSIKNLEELESKLKLVEKYNSILDKIPLIAEKITTEPDLQDLIKLEFVSLIKTLED